MMQPTESTFIIPQAVYADPMSRGQAGGNRLAYSAAMQQQDATQLDQLAGIPDPTEEQNYPCPYFSFLPLKSGNYALTQRFVSGLRRGVNRIVVHSLVFSVEFLDQHQWEIEGIRALCHFSQGNPNSAATTYAGLQIEAGKKELVSLPDLYYTGPANDFPWQAWEVLRRKQEYLRNNCGWSCEQLRTRLIGATTALISGKYVVFSKDSAQEQLLSLVWSSLPPVDRRSVTWNTFPWPGVSCQLNTSPFASSALGALGLEAITKLATKATSALRSLIELYVPENLTQLIDKTYTKRLLYLRDGLWNHKLSLQQPQLLQAWLHFASSDTVSVLQEFAVAGNKTLNELQHTLEIFRSSGFGSGTTPPWLQNNLVLILQGVCLTGLNLLRNCADANIVKTKLGELHKKLGNDTLHALVPDSVWLLKQATDTPKLEVALLAVALILVSNSGKPPITHLELFEALNAQHKAAKGTSFRKQYAAILSLVQAELSFVVLSNKSVSKEMDKDAQTILRQAVSTQPELLDELVPRFLELPKATSRLLHILWELAVSLDNTMCCQNLLQKSLLDFLLKHPGQANEEWLTALPIVIENCPVPVLMDCLEKWSEPAFDVARVALRKRLNGEDAHSIATYKTLNTSLQSCMEKAWQGQPVADWTKPVGWLFTEWMQSSATVSKAETLAVSWWQYLAQAQWIEPLPDTAMNVVMRMLPQTSPLTSSQLVLWQQVVNVWLQLTHSAIRPGEELLIKGLLDSIPKLDGDSYIVLKIKYDILQIRQGKQGLAAVFKARFPYSHQEGQQYESPVRISLYQTRHAYTQGSQHQCADSSLPYNSPSKDLPVRGLNQVRQTITKDEVIGFLHKVNATPGILLDFLNTPLLMTGVVEQNVVEWCGQYVLEEFVAYLKAVSLRGVRYPLLLNMASYMIKHKDDPKIQPLIDKFRYSIQKSNDAWAMAVLDGQLPYP